MNNEISTKKLRSQIRNWTIFFIFLLAISGITAFPIESELGWLLRHRSLLPDTLFDWVYKVYQGISLTNLTYPFISYGTDWLAFAHLMIALLFIGIFIDPIRNKWVVEWAMICCVLVFPLALIAGPIRGIPFFHQLIDCSFGVIGIIPLVIIRSKIITLEKATQSN